MSGLMGFVNCCVDYYYFCCLVADCLLFDLESCVSTVYHYAYTVLENEYNDLFFVFVFVFFW